MVLSLFQLLLRKLYPTNHRTELYILGNMKLKAHSPGGEGMLWNKPTSSVTKPCSNCMIIGMNAGLEYPDGNDANTDSMMWLHHVSLLAVALLSKRLWIPY
jgi:hypothetical protein